MLPNNPPKDPLIDMMIGLRDVVRQFVANATWAFTFACALAFASCLVWPLVPDQLMTRGFLSLFALSLGARIGKSIDRRPPRRDKQ